MRPRIGIVDSGINQALQHRVRDARFFGPEAQELAPLEGQLVHGSVLARLILEQCPQADLLVAQIFRHSRQAAVAHVVEAIDWLVDGGAQLINMSFGLQQASPVLQQACQRARQAGVLLLASVPARGQPTYPAAFAECLAVSGDARCTVDEISWLNLAHVDFGGNPMIQPGAPEQGGGSSFACARVAGMAAALLAEGHPAETVDGLLRQKACHVGPERRLA
ncbi:hypothetical protein AXX04_04160 [Pseudomonas aeruginosa]|uniref:subtilisin-like serine protease QhpE n=1 Tax=Pseudomonas aeruginosa TaxID=287 RepID=UPI000E687F5A|nr:S8 family serine peptidase [Pseudomonas aeruginosa]RIZ43679.1 hypothetical protein AXX04_04160 [Pseudomonas aeruginosa]